MLIGAHVILYTKDADRTRAFFRDTLGFANVDAGDGWLIFALPPAELGVHPDDTGGRHELYLMCDDVEKTVKELEAKGVKFTQPVRNLGWGKLTTFQLPGVGDLGLYQPLHPMAIRAARSAAAAGKRPTAAKKTAGGSKKAAGRKTKKPAKVARGVVRSER
jgi:catechol 2,3-dioxygenase-like lactoylglutathione lyase family enzyme